MVAYTIISADSSPCYQVGMKISIDKMTADMEFVISNTVSDLTQALISTRYDLLILDSSIVERDNINTLSTVIHKHRTRVLLLFDELTPEVRKVEKIINCCGILKKTADSIEFNSAVITLLQGGCYFPAYPDAKPRVSALSEEEFSLLTAKELSVLVLLTKGDLNKQIAGQLNITEDTVKAHVSNMLKKLRIPNRTTLAIANFRASFLTDNQPTG